MVIDRIDMFCPQCGSTQGDDLKFCKTCGANLHALRRIMASRDESDDKFDWSKTWVAEMFMSGEEATRREAEIERLKGVTPETKRKNEIKAGIIVGSVGIALMITLFVLMGGIIASGRVSDAAAEILSRIWIVGLIPLSVGIALVVNGTFVSKKTAPDKSIHETGAEDRELTAPDHSFLPPKAETSRLRSDVFSVTDETTKHLKVPRDR